MTDLYRDPWITCTDDALRIRGYYFRWGATTIPYASIRSVQRVRLTVLTGRLRIWGTTTPSMWASLDPGRMSKDEGFALDLGRRVRPFITPQDPAAVDSVLRRHAVPVGAADDRP